MPLTDEFPAVAAAVSAAVGPAVVRIGRDGRGSGVVISDGVILTSAHNVRGEAATVTFLDGRSATGALAASDADADLAVLNVDTAGVATVGFSAAAAGELVLGTPVVALALPVGGGLRITFGSVSALGRAFRGPRGRLISDGVEHTAPLGRGSSGGPLLDFSGRLLGVNTHRLGQGFYLSVPATASLIARVEALSRGETPVRRRMGIGLAPAGVAARLRAAVGLPAREGVLVREVAEGSPAETAGVARGDLIVEAAGQAIVSVDALLSAVDSVGADGALELMVVRGVEEIRLQVRFPAR